MSVALQRPSSVVVLLSLAIGAPTLSAADESTPSRTPSQSERGGGDTKTALPPSEPAWTKPAPGTVSRTTALSEDVLAIWNDPAFARAFAQSYVAETEIEPRLSDVERAAMLEIYALIAADKMDEAAALIEINRSDTSSATFDFTLANIYFQRDDLSRATPIYEVAVEKWPKFRRAWKNLALIRVRQGDFARAVPALTRVIELGGADALTYGLLGFGHASLEDNISAESAYRMAILLDPATRDWKLGLARSFFRQERFADAIALTSKLLSDAPEAADLWMLQANAYIGLNQPLKAAQNFEIVDRLGKASADSLNMLGDIYVNEELFSAAVDCYSRAMAMTSAPPPDRAVRAAKVLAARGASADCRTLLARVEEVYADRLDGDMRKELLKLRARIAAAEQATATEAEILTQIVELDPLDGEALILLGQYHARAGDADRAVFLYERAASIERFEADAKVRHAQLLVGQGKYAEALPLLRQAQQVKPRENIQQYLDQVERAARGRA